MIFGNRLSKSYLFVYLFYINNVHRQPLHGTSESSIRRPIYPNVPKRTQRIPSINEQ
jgi:hypothetical protein